MNAVHQFHPACAPGDGVTNGLFITQKLLRDMGCRSEIYCEHIPEPLRDRVRHVSELEDRPGDALLFHHSLGYRNIQWIERVRARRVLVYHNITPQFLLPEGELRELSALGRDQIASLRPLFRSSIADSDENAHELRALGYTDVRVIPLLIDFDRYAGITPDRAVLQSLQDSVNVLFVGRIAENKRQSDLVDCFEAYRRLYEPRARLVLPGATASGGYRAGIERKVKALELHDAVQLPGKVSDEALAAYYHGADLFVSLSEHEGFGIPLIEAMAYGVPVLAHASASVPWTVGAGGILLRTRDPEYVAAVMHEIVSNAGLRRAMRRGARRSLRRFEAATLRRELSEMLGVDGPARAETAEARGVYGHWRVEGPFDSSYSLAIVNRNLGLALARTVPTGLWSTEGGGDFAPDPAFLDRNRDVQALAQVAEQRLAQDVTLRFCYPPRTEGMLGLVRAIHTYGWEETGFPARYARWFNQRLDLVTVLSGTVKKILQDAGVRVPMAVVGAGVDHLPVAAGGDGFAAATPRPFRFLHVSSCFPRKAPDVMLEAWGRAFTVHDDVELVIKTFPNPHHDLAADIAALRQRHPDVAPVRLINEDVEEGVIAGLYAAADAYVGAARGEGFGMPLAEAMLHGLPVITTAWGGQTDFCDAGTAWLVDYAFDHSRSHLNEGVSLWAEPGVDALAGAMREVRAASEAERRARTDKARERALAMTWAEVAARTRRAVAALDSLPQVEPAPRVGWITTWNSRCGIAEYSRYLVQGLKHPPEVILANRTDDVLGEDLPSVSRCWESGLAANPLEEALEHIGLKQLDALVIQYNFGFFRLRTLADLIERLRAEGKGAYCFFHSTMDFMHGDEWISLGSIRESLAKATRLFVHSLEDLNRLKGFGLAHNATLFLHGVREPLPMRASEPEQELIACFGFLLPGKGLPQLIDAFARLAQGRPSLRLRLVNALYPAPVSGEEHARCLEQVRALGLEERVDFVTRFMGEDEVLEQLADARLVVFPYQGTRESSSAAVRQGIAAGRPVAVTPLPIFDDVREAVFTLPGTAAAEIAEGIEALLRTPGLEREAAERIAAWSRPRSWPVLSERLEGIIESCTVTERFDAALARLGGGA